VWQHLRQRPVEREGEAADVAASFQEAVIDMLLDTTFAAAEAVAAPRLVIAGGVSANSRLRARAVERGAAMGMPVCIPPLRYCTDNAAMIALAARARLARGDSDPLSVNAVADLEL
jgi:N6-L-threonylcarbamoyladenine synthase